ncbi:hypothetical protein JA9_002328 [Meyerozyma sp. JA9]|nr:hypothetical protein JA9_002328 [Meyerozyma sp. JA9]
MNLGIGLFYFIVLLRCTACYELDLNMFNYWAQGVCDKMSPWWSQVIIGISDDKVVVSASGNTFQYQDFTEYTSRGMSSHGVPIAARYSFPTSLASNISMTVIGSCAQGTFTNLTQAQFDGFGLSKAQMQVRMEKRS